MARVVVAAGFGWPGCGLGGWRVPGRLVPGFTWLLRCRCSCGSVRSGLRLLTRPVPHDLGRVLGGVEQARQCRVLAAPEQPGPLVQRC